LAKLVKVQDVIRDGDGDAIWVRVRYVEEVIESRGEDSIVLRHLLHDAAFMPTPDGWVFPFKKITTGYIPPKRYQKMAKKAHSIIRNIRPKELKQQKLPFKEPLE